MDADGKQWRVRRVEDRDREAWLLMRCELWPEGSREEHLADIERYPADGVVLVAEGDAGLAGFVELSIRNYAEGCDGNRVPFVEGWYVNAAHRGRGVGRALVAAAETWARRQGFTELASDALIDNRDGIAAHLALGFEEVERIVCFRKKI